MSITRKTRVEVPASLRKKSVSRAELLDSAALRLRTTLYEWRSRLSQEEAVVEILNSIDSHRRRPDSRLGKIHQSSLVEFERLKADIEAVELLLDERRNLLQRIFELSIALQNCHTWLSKVRDQFSFYAKSHRAKNTSDSREKAIVNESLAEELTKEEMKILELLRKK